MLEIKPGQKIHTAWISKMFHSEEEEEGKKSCAGSNVRHSSSLFTGWILNFVLKVEAHGEIYMGLTPRHQALPFFAANCSGVAPQ